MQRTFKILMTTAACVHLTGCATATVLKKDTQDLSTATATMLVESRNFYRGLDEKRRDYMLRAVVDAQDCSLDWQALLLPDDKHVWRCLTQQEIKVYVACKAQEVGADCPPGGMPKALQSVQSYDLVAPQRSAAFKLIEICAEYQTLLARIVKDPKHDTAEELKAVSDKVNALSGTLEMVSGQALGKLDYKNELNALGALADLLRQLHEDRKDLRQLRTLMSQPGGAAERFDAALTGLNTRYQSLDKGLWIELQRNETDLALREFNEKHGPTSHGDEVYARAAEIIKARAAVNALADRPDVIARQFDALQKSHAVLRNAIVNGEYTESQRKRRVSESLTQLKTWFEAITTVIKMF